MYIVASVLAKTKEDTDYDPAAFMPECTARIQKDYMATEEYMAQLSMMDDVADYAMDDDELDLYNAILDGPEWRAVLTSLDLDTTRAAQRVAERDRVDRRRAMYNPDHTLRDQFVIAPSDSDDPYYDDFQNIHPHTLPEVLQEGGFAALEKILGEAGDDRPENAVLTEFMSGIIQELSTYAPLAYVLCVVLFWYILCYFFYLYVTSGFPPQICTHK